MMDHDHVRNLGSAPYAGQVRRDLPTRNNGSTVAIPAWSWLVNYELMVNTYIGRYPSHAAFSPGPAYALHEQDPFCTSQNE